MKLTLAIVILSCAIHCADQATNCVVIMDRNHLLIRHNRKTVSVSSYDECIRQCRSAEREYFFTCNSGQYYADFKTDNCILNKETRKTLPDLYRATYDNNVYFELQCSTTANQGATCFAILNHNHMLIGQNRKTVDALSYDQCIEQCLSSEQQFFFTCHSGQYYVDFTTDNCILNNETRKTKSHLYLATDDNNVYFDLRCTTTDLDAIPNARIGTPMLCEPVLKRNKKPDCSKGVTEDVITGARKYGCKTNTVECRRRINFPRK